jgi:hypothetical protein
MKFLIWPFVCSFLILIIKDIFVIKNIRKKFLHLNGFIASIFLTLCGYILGFFINGQDTLIPAHYHASIGGVTVAFMTVSFLMLKFYNINIRIKNELFFIKYQPLIFGLGQFIFVLGFAYAGLYGAKRKIFGPNPSIYSYEKIIGLTTMGIGSIIAIFGGILFLFFFIRVFYSFYSKIFFPKKSNKPND